LPARERSSDGKRATGVAKFVVDEPVQINRRAFGGPEVGAEAGERRTDPAKEVEVVSSDAVSAEIDQSKRIELLTFA